ALRVRHRAIVRMRNFPCRERKQLAFGIAEELALPAIDVEEPAFGVDVRDADRRELESAVEMLLLALDRAADPERNDLAGHSLLPDAWLAFFVTAILGGGRGPAYRAVPYGRIG